MNEAALQRLADRLALEDLVIRYANAIDRRDFEALDAVFTADAHIDYRAMGGIAGDYPAVKAWLPQALGAFPAYMHLLGNFEFHIDGDVARGRVACFNPMVLPAGLPESAAGGDRPGPQASPQVPSQMPPQTPSKTMFLGLWYVDDYRRTADGWRITRRSEEKCYVHNMPEWMQKALKQ